MCLTKGRLTVVWKLKKPLYYSHCTPAAAAALSPENNQPAAYISRYRQTNCRISPCSLPQACKITSTCVFNTQTQTSKLFGIMLHNCRNSSLIPELKPPIKITKLSNTSFKRILKSNHKVLRHESALCP